MQNRITHQQNADSDNDEGFVLNVPEIKHKEQPKMTLNSTSRPTDYEPRYLNSYALLKKQMPEVSKSYPHFANEENTNTYRHHLKKDREVISKVQQHSFPNKNYQMVYHRSNKKYSPDSINTQHPVDLASSITYSADNYSIFKKFDLKATTEELTFDSRFQCGNLLCAYKSLVAPSHYILFLQNDTNSKGYNKWFNFAVRNQKKHLTYTFSIVNFRKNIVFIKQGMKPVRYSHKEQEAKGNGWSKCANKVHMYRSKICEESELNPYNEHYTLTFEVTFDYENDLNFFSLLPPYSYSKLTNFLLESQKALTQKPAFKFTLKTISYTLSNTQVPYLTISAPQPSKKNIVILARQHPGQVWSSFCVQSLIRELLRDSFPQKEWLLKHYTFRIFPMINIDGVIYGNFRCDLSGMDLNRSWKEPNKLLHPHLVAIKQQIRRLSVQQQVASCLDLHSHSKQYNIFAYCCKTDHHGRLLPLLLSKTSPLFYFPYCTFGISRYKQTTARAVVYDITRAPDVLTIESSFFAASNPYKVITPSVFMALSYAIIKALKHYYAKDQEYIQAQEQLPKAMAQVAALRAKNREKYALKDESGSDSEPDIDQIALTEKIGKILPKCPVVEEAFGLKQQATKLETITQVKKESPNKKKNDSKRAQQKIIKLARNTISQEPMIRHKAEKSPPSMFITRSRMNSNNKNTTTERFLQPLPSKRSKDTILERLKRQKEREKNHKFPIKQRPSVSIDLQTHKKTTINKFLAQELGSTFRKKSLRYEMQQVHEQKQQQFPLLCVLSDSKKEAHLQKLKRIHPSPSPRQKTVVRFQPTLIINKKLDTMQRLRERQQKSSDLVSQLWRDTLHYDQEGPITRIFYAAP